MLAMKRINLMLRIWTSPLAAITLLFLQAVPAHAFIGDKENEARGMVVFSIPFSGSTSTTSSPALRLEFGLRKDITDYGYDDERLDLRSGARLQSFELAPLHSWSVKPNANQIDRPRDPRDSAGN